MRQQRCTEVLGERTAVTEERASFALSAAGGQALSDSEASSARRMRYQAIEFDNHRPDNTGLPLYFDFVNPLVGLGLLALRERLTRRREAPSPTSARSTA